jgi:hypothetical protein
MQTNLTDGTRVRVLPSGETGRITRVMRTADDRPAYQIEFDQSSGSSRGGTGETGGLYVLEDIEVIE